MSLYKLEKCEPGSSPGSSQELSLNVPVRRSTNLNNFRLLIFSGLTDGTALTPNFTTESIEGKTLTIKRLKFSFYAPTGQAMVNAFQSTTPPNTYTPGTYLITPENGLILPEFISNYAGFIVTLIVNGQFSVFYSVTGIDADMDMDNLYLKFGGDNAIPLNTNGIQMFVNGTMPDDFAGAANQINVNVKVSMECFFEYPF